MFEALGKLVVRRRWWVLAAWLAAAVVIIATAPKLTSTQDTSAFLPKKYESIKALDVQLKAFPEQGQIGAIVVFDRQDGKALTKDDQATVASIADKLNGETFKTLGKATAPPPSDNGIVQGVIVGVQEGKNAFDTSATDDVKKMRADLADWVKGTGLHEGVAGSAAQQLDSQKSTEKTLGIVLGVTFLLILVLLALIFRSVVVCLLPLVVIIVLSFVALGLISFANKLFDLKADSSIQVILSLVLFGIGTDYILFFLFRYREALRSGMEGSDAVSHAVTRAGEAIASAGGAVIVAFLAMILSTLSIFRSIGPALAIAVFTTVLAALTLVPALVSVVGTKRLSWPSKTWLAEPDASRFRSIGTSVGKHPARYAIASAGVLGLLSVFGLSFNPTFDFSSGGDTSVESAKALVLYQKNQSAGASDPTQVFVETTDGSAIDKASLDPFTQALQGVDGVASAALVAVKGDVAAYSVVLDSDPNSKAALALVKGPLRTTAHEAAPQGTEALVGGTTAVSVDVDTAMNRDYRVVFPVAAAIILLILALLLRSLVAPLYLMVSVGLGFGASIGATVLVFQKIGGHTGLIFLLPIYVYLFVVALGTDYNILMVARLREEARGGLPPRDAAAKAIEHAGPTIAAAGLILSGTFATLILGPGLFFKSLGFAFGIGIAMAAFVMALFLTPSLTALVGRKAWWPGHGDESQHAD